MHIRHRFVAALSATALALAFVASASTAAAQTPIEVEQGREVSLGVIDFGASAYDDPAEAGTFEFVPSEPGGTRGELFFTASTSFTGSARVLGVDGSGQPFTIAVVNVVGSLAAIDSSFTPRPAPGPCIVIESGGTVAFGDVTVGTTATAPTETVVRNCSTLQLAVGGSVSPAVVNVGNDLIVWAPAIERRQPGPNEFRHTVTPDGVTFAILDDRAVENIDLLAPGSTTSLEHSLDIGPGSTTGLNSQFSARILLTATVT